MIITKVSSLYLSFGRNTLPTSALMIRAVVFDFILMEARVILGTIRNVVLKSQR